MKASEARKVALSQNDSKLNQELEAVYKRINTAVKCGELECSLFMTLSEWAINALEKDGYDVDAVYDGQSQMYSYIIKW
ncbi:hypothetical protein [Sphingobacterium sp. BIGb0116]|uniref:hypothetical protein n=1 Tax=Sphingobacterium sp. BIGb0116 TaxID=2940619 RepID=UPI0021678CB7|nr:hypothetical protein [Sphingobacterium sp. BIGb0116]MCS4164445.1 hypothetical protein [Sphingobacterium sp. BIGb0116]